MLALRQVSQAFQQSSFERVLVDEPNTTRSSVSERGAAHISFTERPQQSSDSFDSSVHSQLGECWFRIDGDGDR